MVSRPAQRPAFTIEIIRTPLSKYFLLADFAFELRRGFEGGFAGLHARSIVSYHHSPQSAIMPGESPECVVHVFLEPAAPNLFQLLGQRTKRAVSPGLVRWAIYHQGDAARFTSESGFPAELISFSIIDRIGTFCLQLVEHSRTRLQRCKDSLPPIRSDFTPPKEDSSRPRWPPVAAAPRFGNGNAFAFGSFSGSTAISVGNAEPRLYSSHFGAGHFGATITTVFTDLLAHFHD